MEFIQIIEVLTRRSSTSWPLLEDEWEKGDRGQAHPAALDHHP